MPSDHFAIVIGLKSYPRLGDPPPSDLEGPENDAKLVAGWLTDPVGGGLPDTNVTTIVSKDCNSPPSAAPTPADVNKAIRWLDDLADKNQKAGRGRKVGARLYIYVSGHGCAPKPRQGCLLTGDAALNEISSNICPIEWIDWLQSANYFREYVLWQDCCTDRQIFTVPSAAPFKPLFASNPAGPAFIALAAPYGLRAVEKPVPDDADKWHGVFTWSLVQGLRGAAADANGTVTSQSLTNWLRHAQYGWLDDADRNTVGVAAEPDFVDNDPLTFGTGLSPILFDVTLRIPGAPAPIVTRIWSGSPPAVVNQTAVGADGVAIKLRSGLYLADTDTGFRHGFSVMRNGVVDLTDKGPAVGAHPGPCALRIDPGDPAADIILFDGDLDVVDRNTGKRELPALRPGLYKIRIRVGRKLVEQVVLLDRDWPPDPGPPAAGPVVEAPASLPLPPMPQIISAAPLPGTRMARIDQADAVRDALKSVEDPQHTAEILIASRLFSGEGGAPNDAGWSAVSLNTTTQTTVADLAKDPLPAARTADPIVARNIAVSPGNYEIHFRIGEGAQLGLSLIVPPGGWRMESYFLRYGSSPKPALTLLMRRIGAPWGNDADVAMQKALVALADERPVGDGELIEQLLGTFDNPLAMIVGAHLLLIAGEKAGSPVPARLNEIVTRLRAIVGDNHSDVQSLSRLCPDAALRAVGPIVAPPTFERSWRILIRESFEHPELIPVDLWRRANASLPYPPYLCWATDAAVQSAYLEAQAKQIARYETPAVAPPPAPSWAGAVLGHVSAWVGAGLDMIMRRHEAVPADLGDAIVRIDAIRRRMNANAMRIGIPAAALEALKELQQNAAPRSDTEKPAAGAMERTRP